MADLLQHVRESGFRFPDRLIHLFVGGSELHCAKVYGTDDLDIYGVFVEPPDTLPRPERDFLIRVRTGKCSMDKVLAMAKTLFSECEEAAKSSPLSERVDRSAVSSLLAHLYRRAWEAG